jgi:hypothetical protein
MTATTTACSSSTAAGMESTRRPVPPVVPLPGDGPAMRGWAEALFARARADGVELTGDDGLLTALVRQVLQTGL